jgi:large subunit ribosomal protein L30
MAMVKITQVKSRNNRLVKQQRTLEALGLRGIRKSVIKEDNVSLRGMIRVVEHIVKVEAVK